MSTINAADGGWFSAVADRNLNSVMSAIHAQPAERWTVDALARVANMSRSAFALRFKEILGLTPMEYLIRWRMLLASDRLINSADELQCKPPPIINVSPVIQPASSLTRNATAGAISCGRPIRPKGVTASIVLRKSSAKKPLSRTPSVSTNPGLTEFTRILREPNSLANVRVTASTAPLDAV